MNTKVRITEDFILTFDSIKKRISASAFNKEIFLEIIESDIYFQTLVAHFDALVRILNEYEKLGRSKTVKQVHQKFPKYWKEFKDGWSALPLEYLHWQIGPTDPVLLDKILFQKPLEESNITSYERWDFDPEEDSAADLVNCMVEYVDNHAYDGGGHFSRMAQAFVWFQERGLDLGTFEKRWRKIPTIFVPAHVSDPHSIHGKEGLYWLLDQALQAFWFKADAAAITLCRALTEDVVEQHYLKRRCSDNMPSAIREIERTYPHLKKLNMVDKIRVANDILHNAKLGSLADHKKWANEETFVREWVLALKILIEFAPKSGR